MATRSSWLMGAEELNDHADSVKACVIGALIHEKLLNPEIADEWAKTHTVIMTQQTFFKSVLNRVCRRPEKNTMYYKVVKCVPIPDEKEMNPSKGEVNKNGD